MNPIASSLGPVVAVVVVGAAWLGAQDPAVAGTGSRPTAAGGPASTSAAAPAGRTVQAGRVGGGRAVSVAGTVRGSGGSGGTVTSPGAAAVGGGRAARGAGAVPAPHGRWQWPLTPRPAVARPFVPPRSTWGAGHRGADLAAAVGQPVLAVADGTVTHVGVVAGRPTLTVTHAGGLRSTYEPVRAAVHAGDTVTTGQVLGTLVADASHCSPAACLHLGALRGREYLDPLSLLRPVRVRLLPLWRPTS